LVPTQLGRVGNERRKQLADAVLQEMQQDGKEGAMIENIALMVLLMVLGIGITWAVLLGFLYWMEIQND